MRACVEVEANCKAILEENGYSRAGDWTMADYKKLNNTHRLSSYRVKFPLWNGTEATRKPFSPWASGATLPWYDAYNTTKHNRHNTFEQASFRQLTDAVSGLAALLGSQFYTRDFSNTDYLVAEYPSAEFAVAIGNYFLIGFPNDWPMAERYGFHWPTLKKDIEPFARLSF
jgi:hypothetical protein